MNFRIFLDISTVKLLIIFSLDFIRIFVDVTPGTIHYLRFLLRVLQSSAFTVAITYSRKYFLRENRL